VRKQLLPSVNLTVGDFECNDLIGVRSKQQELEALVLWLLALLEGTHKAMSGLCILLNLRVLNLK
jgi:hypothetical protein